ncbi:MAG TPA: alpha/beta fold hydrolase [Pseudolabrys sp.]|nr:alpha/beta fold hydrolase [Pseudolabrys sp.]
MPFADVQDAKLYYETHGEGDPVVFATGLGGMASFWQPHIESVARNFQVVVYDHRGTGQSTKSPPPYSVNAMADDVLALMDHLRIERAHFVGHSTGGAIGQVLGARHGDRIKSLLLAGTWGRRDPFFRRCFDARLPVLHALGPKAYVELTSLLLYPPKWISQNYDELLGLEAANAAGMRYIDILEARIKAICDFDMSEEHGNIKVPTLLVSAKDDMTTASFFAEELHAAIPGSRLRMLESGGHFFPLTERDAFKAVLNDWLLERRQS